MSPNEKGEEPEGGQLDKAEKEGLKTQTSGVSLSGVSPFLSVLCGSCRDVCFQEWSALDEQVKDIQASLEQIHKDEEGAEEEPLEEKAVHGSESESESEDEEEEEGD